MKPKTALENTIVTISNSLPPIIRKYHESALPRCFANYAVQSRNSIFCLECGHAWKQQQKKLLQKITCVNCGKKLELNDKYKNGIKETNYYQIVTALKGFQIVRMVCITKTMKKKARSSYFAHEVMQIFIDQNGNSRYLSKNVMGMSQYYDQWIIGSALTLKPNVKTIRFSLCPAYVFPNKKIIPMIKRNGFKGNFHSIAPQLLFKAILTDSIAETLLKAGQFDMLYYHIRNTALKRDGIYWNALKICMRKNYIIKDAKLWIDYIDLLEFYWKDIKSPKYLCPTVLEKAHDKLMERKQKEILNKTFDEKKLQIAKNQIHYFKAKKHFFGLFFSHKGITVNVIESVKDFLEEGCIHNHCVFTNEYYKKTNSLILSAKVNGIPMETVQVSLNNLEILQSRGKGNKASPYNKQILNLVTRNLHQIGNRMKMAG